MPLYKFRCASCNTEQEHLSKLDETEKLCECGGVANKIFSANAGIFRVNGAGAYNSGQMKGK